MIIARAPYRVSFAGGGSDLPAFCDHKPGCVVSTTIDRHIYVQISRRFENDFVVRYGQTDHAQTIEGIAHPIIRECLLLHAPRDPLEIVVTGDLPGGTGLGSSGTLTVATLAALDAWRGRSINPRALAQQATLIEMGRLKRPIGYQDQYAAAYGGLNEIRFRAKADVWVEPLREVSPETRETIRSHALMVYLGGFRDATGILADQSRASSTPQASWLLESMATTAKCVKRALFNGDIPEFGRRLDEGWKYKRSLGCQITSDNIDQAYDAAKMAGAWGGKLLGAGGGGFLFLIAPPERHEAIRASLGHPRELPFRMSQRGAEIIHDDGVRS